MPLIVDCFLFYNEIEMLNYRFAVSSADYFVIVESTQTFAGNPKELYFSKVKIPSKFNGKIVHIIADNTPETKDPWVREAYQRNSIDKGINYLIKNLYIKEDDYILISDVDEIPNPQVLNSIKKGALQPLSHLIFSLEMVMYYYNLNTIMNLVWQKAKILTLKEYAKCPFPEQIRLSPVSNNLEEGGWHLSFFGDEYFIQNKIQNASHQEINKPSILNLKTIREKISTGSDLVPNRAEKFSQISIYDNKYLPIKYELYLKNFYSF